MQRARRGQQLRAGLEPFLVLTQFVHQPGDGRVLKAFAGPLQGPAADDRDAGLNGTSKKRLTIPFVELRRQHRDFVQPQEQCVAAMVCRKVHAGDRERVGQGRAPAVRSERRNGHCPLAQDVGGQDIAKHERRRNPPVNVKRMRDAEMIVAQFGMKKWVAFQRDGPPRFWRFQSSIAWVKAREAAATKRR